MQIHQVGIDAFNKLLQLLGCTEKTYNPLPRDVLFDPAWNHSLNEHFNITSDSLLTENEARWRIGRELTRRGLRYVNPYTAKSGFALALEIVNNQVLRIVKQQNEASRLGVPQVLQPTVIVGTVDDYHIEVLPKVNTQDVTLEHIETLVTALAQQGYIFWDVKPENVGLLEDGTPVVLDAGATVPISDMYKPILCNVRTDSHIVHFGREMQRTYEHFGKILQCGDDDLMTSPESYFETLKNRPVAKYHWEKAQQAHLKALGLETGEISGVFSDKEIAALRRVMGGKAGVIIRGLLDGANKHDLGELSDKALQRFQSYGEEEGKEWRDYLTEELAGFKRKLPPQGTKFKGESRFW